MAGRKQSTPRNDSARELREARAQQAATAAILRVIQRSRGDAQPVFNAIVRSARLLTGGVSAQLTRVIGDSVHLVAFTATTRAGDKSLKKLYPLPRSSDHLSAAAIRTRRPVLVADIETDRIIPAKSRAVARARGFRSIVYVPMISQGIAIGAIHVAHREPGSIKAPQIALLKAFADQAVIAIENARLFGELEASEERYDVAMRAINEGVYDWNIAGNTIYYSDRVFAALRTPKGDATAKAWRDRIHPDDLAKYDAALVAHFKGKTPRFECDYRYRRDDGKWHWARQHGIAVRDMTGRAVRMIGSTGNIDELKRNELELHRAHDETKQALERQTATAEILKVIARSPSDVQPVFDAIVRNAVRVCDGVDAVLNLRDGDEIQTSAHWGPVGSVAGTRRALNRESVTGRSILNSQTIHVRDLARDRRFPEGRRLAAKHGHRTTLGVPLLRDGKAIGALLLRRPDVRPFSEHQIDMVRTFADQAVIAIENVRLFNETKNSLARQTATANILHVLGGSMTDTQPVFDAIVKNGHALFKDSGVFLRLAVDGHLQVKARIGGGVSMDALPIDRKSAIGICVVEGRAQHFPDLMEAAKKFPRIRSLGLKHGFRSGIYAPLLHGKTAIGAIGILRRQPGAFEEKDVELAKTFASQAVIAIENARLFNETKESLERQTATADVLKVIAGSPADVQPVFEAILRSATRLCSAERGLVFRYDGELLQCVAAQGLSKEARAEFFSRAVRPTPASGVGHAIGAKKPYQVADITDDEAYRRGDPLRVRTAKLLGARTAMWLPLLKGDKVVGTFAIYRKEVQPFTEQQIELVQTFADQAAIAIENVRLFNETKEALERQTATAEILKVIASSPSDVQPVFEAIAASALTLLRGYSAAVVRLDNGYVRLAALTSINPEADEALRRIYPYRLAEGAGLNARAMRTRAPSVLSDSESDANFSTRHRELARARGYRSALSVPMLRSDGTAIGAINVTRKESGAFLDHHIKLLQTFASQAVIAIENVRLFNETKEALERQTAISEVLRVISSSPADVNPVLEAVAKRAAIICASSDARIFLAEQGHLRYAAGFGDLPPAQETFPINRASASGRAVIDKKPIHLADVLAAENAEFALAREIAGRGGWRTVLCVPLMRESEALGSINLRRKDVQPFDDKQIALLQTFADQAAIAIENARLFNETKDALEQQTATAEILKIISSSPTDTRPVFEGIVDSVANLCQARIAAVVTTDGRSVQLAASKVDGKALAHEFMKLYPMPLEKAGLQGIAIAERRLVNVPDLESEPRVAEWARGFYRDLGIRSGIWVPMFRHDQVIGLVIVFSRAPGAFAEKQLKLLKTFADQAVIAIENVRLFNETKESLERQTATAEILKVIASSPADVQPVFDAIVQSAARLFGRKAGLRLVEADGARRKALSHPDPAGLQGSDILPVDRESLAGRVLLEGRAQQVVDTLGADAPPYAKAHGRELNFRSNASAPLMREGKAIGTISVNSAEPGALSEKQMELLQTFADQAVIAIENVRLFNETKEALERQTATAEILKVISASPTDTAPVFETILENATRLCDAHLGLLGLYDGEKYQTVAHRGGSAEFADWVIGRGRFVPSGGAGLQEMLAGKHPVHHPDYRDAPAYIKRTPMTVSMVELGGVRTYLAVPMLKEGRVVGGITIYRPEVRPFTQKQIDLVSTFASQAVIAIENVRLFKELQQRIGQMTSLREVGQAISSTLDLETVLKTIVQHAVKLTGLEAGAIYEYDETLEEFRLRAAEGMTAETAENLRNQPIRKGEGSVGRTAVTREPVQVEDIQRGDYDGRLREILMRAGRRSVLAVPLLRNDRIIGAINVQKAAPGPFAPEVIELLKTFATQSAMAIQNARLFREIAEKGKQLEIASQHKSQFLASMSHELRTPLNAILGFNEMVLDEIYGELPPDVKPPLQNMQTSGKHLLRLINNVLDLAKIEAGRMELALGDYSVQDTVASVHSTLKPLAAEKGLEFLAEAPADIPLAFGDAGRLAQCLMNLAGNSLKFTKQGKVEIAVAQSNGLLRYRVSDTGIGIAPDKIGSLFTEFKQTDATIASEYGGTGLGLSITKKFIEMHGGRIWVESEPGKGSAFIFEVPLRVKT